MTETEWLTCDEWRPMVDFLAGKISPRKAMFYLAGGLRCIWNLLFDDTSRAAVEMAERAADGRGTRDEIWLTRYLAESPTFGFQFDQAFIRLYMSNGNYDSGVKRLLGIGVFTEADILGADIPSDEHLGDSATFERLLNAAKIAEHCLYLNKDNTFSPCVLRHLSSQSEWPGGWLIREVFENPFRQVAIGSECLSWNGGTVPVLGRRIYDNRAFEYMPILGDALEEAGCEETAILDHCRSRDRHVRGCWVLDLLLALHTVGPVPANFMGLPREQRGAAHHA